MKHEIIDLPVAALIERPRNANRMTDEQFKLLVEAVRSTGCIQPPLVRNLPPLNELSPKALETALTLDQGWEIIDGVHRIRAAKEVGLRTVPCVVVECTEPMAAALQLGLNRMRGEVDLNAALYELQLLADIQVTGGDVLMGLTGFAPDELEALLSSTMTPALDEVLDGASGAVPEVQDEPEPGGTITLEIKGFTDAAELRTAKRALRKAGAGDLRVGLMRILGELQPTTKRRKT